MKDQRLVIGDIVKNIDSATLGRLDIPEFQRGFVWRPEKAKNLVDSIWRGYPIGTILLWESDYNEPQTAQGNAAQKLWIVDGQQRITTFSLLFGKKPYWWQNAAEWNELFAKYDVLVNIKKPLDDLEFGLPDKTKKKSPNWLSIRSIITTTNLSKLAEETAKGINEEFSEIHEKLQSVRKIADYPLYEIVIDHQLEDVSEIFSRLNMAGVKVKESDVIIALVAAYRPGWVREEFNPFLQDLIDHGFDIEPAILVRSLAVIGSGQAKLKAVPKEFWQKDTKFAVGWEATKQSVSYVIREMRNVGILSSDLLPSKNVLIPVIALRSKFQNNFRFNKALYWLLLATKDGRYGSSSVTVLEQDIKTINSSNDFDHAISTLVDALTIDKNFQEEDFLKDYDEEFLRLILYLMIFKNKAKDWIHNILIGYDKLDNQLNEGFKPEWHHFFPKEVLKRKEIEDKKINALANIAVLNEKANKIISSSSPNDYIQKHNISPDRLKEQFIPVDRTYEIDSYDDFLSTRAKILAGAATSYVKDLAELDK